MNVAEAVASGKISGRVWMYANYHCNLACTYCLTASSPTSPRRILPAARMRQIALEAADLGFTDLGVTGGEPFLRPELPELLGALADVLPVVVLTNGTLFRSDALLARMAPLAHKPVALQLSLDAPVPADNDALRAPEAHARTLEAVRRLRSVGIEVRIASTSDHDTGIADWAAEHLDLPEGAHVIRPIVRRGRAAVEDLGEAVTHADLPGELTITTDGAYYSAFGPTVRDGRVDTDLLLSRTTHPLAVPARMLLSVVGGMPSEVRARIR